jgi:DNA-binding response OmpR family regulator
VDKPQLLIVEDDLDLSDMVSSYFRVQNYDVQTAAWGSEALKLLDEHSFDLVMLDVRLPDIDGFELCRRLRETRKTADLPVIFLTEKRDRVDKLHGLELGVIDYITKPFDIQELRLRVRNAIQRANKPSATHSVTSLPQGDEVEERLKLLVNDDKDWAVLQVAIASLDHFRERHGFVAADDVLRAAAIILRNAVREFGTESDFIGHLNSASLLVITSSATVVEMRERIQRRISQFYPLRERKSADDLRFSLATFSREAQTFADVTTLKQALAERLAQA